MPPILSSVLSAEADRDLTGRTYYWNFVERTGAEPETMSFMFVFDPEKRQKSTPEGPQSPSILERYFGITPVTSGSSRMLEEDITFGCRRLDQMFHAAHTKGGYLQLFEETPAGARGTLTSYRYTTWLMVNYKVEMICDMKREELHSLGISMSTGEIVNHFLQNITEKALTPRLPAHTHLRETISLERAVVQLELYMKQLLQQADYQWAQDAQERKCEEENRIDGYYNELLSNLEGEQKDEVTAQYNKRQQEIDWQHRPRIEVKPINCGWFHLLTDSFHPTDA